MNRNVLVMVGGLLLIIGSFLPWASVGSMSLSGVSEGAGDGYISIVLGAALIGISFAGASWSGMALKVLGVLAGAFGLWKLIDGLGMPEMATMEIGLWMVAIGGLLAAVGVFMGGSSGASEEEAAA